MPLNGRPVGRRSDESDVVFTPRSPTSPWRRRAWPLACSSPARAP